MKKILEIHDLVLEINDKTLLDIKNLDFFSGVSVFFCGTSGSGKTLLLKAMAKKIKYRGKINRKGKLETLFHQTSFFSNTVSDELHFLLLDDLQKEIVFRFLNEDILEQNPNKIDYESKNLLLFCKAFVEGPDIVFVDEVMSFLNYENQKKVLEYAKEKNITLVSVSKNIEEALSYDYIIVMDQGSIAIEGKTLQVLQEEKILKRLGIGLPFYVDLSIQLKLYGLLPNICLSKEEMMEALWK